MALYKLHTEADNHSRGLYDNNKAVYSLLRYGVPVKIEAGKVTETVHLINWHEPEKNDFAIAEEVTLRGNHERRPDIVLYVNGIAVGVLELKRSSVSIGDGIRQNISNQRPEFNEWFFSTVQFVFAGNDSEGLRYGTIGTRGEVLSEVERGRAGRQPLQAGQVSAQDVPQGSADRADARLRALRRRRQEAAAAPPVFRHQSRAGARRARREGGIIWHTQGSGKSIVMVLLAKWILENNPHARVAIITDRDELDKQIERVFTDAGETIYRTSSGRDLMRQLGQAKPRLLCSLIHKFGPRGVDNFDAVHPGAGSAAEPDGGRGLRLCGRVPPHRERQAAPDHEGGDAERGLYRLHRHAAAQAGPADHPGSLWQLHPHLQVQRGGGG